MNKPAKADTFGIGVHREEEHTLIATFALDQDIFGVEALSVQEIVRYQRLTPVPHAPPYVLGLINLRGQILTTIDLKYRLTGEPIKVTEESMNIIVKYPDGVASLLVEDVGDVLNISNNELESPPETMPPRIRGYIQSICKLDHRLLNILDINLITAAE